MANRPRPPADVLKKETSRIEKAVRKRERAQQAALDAEMELRDAIKVAFKNGLSASYISDATGLTISRLYQVKRGTRN